MEGTSLNRAKTALAAALDSFDINFLYASPTTAEQVIGPDGTGRACWFDDDNINAELEPAYMVGGPLVLDEVITLPIKIQAIGQESTDTQEEVDAAASDMLGQIIAVVSRDPSLSVGDDEIVTFHAVPSGWTYETGTVDGTNRVGGFVLQIEVTARLSLEEFG